MTPLVDTHSHVDYIVRGGGDADAVMAEARAEGLSWLVNPSTHPDYFADVLKLAETYPEIYAAFAVHPTDVQETEAESVFPKIAELTQHPKVVAIGETGLDYYHDDSHKKIQQAYFEGFLDLACSLNLPVIVHCRDKNDSTLAFDDTAAIISNFPKVKGVMHCFAGDPQFAHAMIEKGFYISFAGNVTFKKATNLHESAIAVPLEWLLIETDAPFLSPEPYRGKPNAPNRVALVAEKIAELRGISVNEVRMQTALNAGTLFNVGQAS